jgi:hypothetical protein
MGTVRDFQSTRSVFAHVKPIDGTRVLRLLVDGVEASVNLWFYEDPDLKEEQRVRWVNKDSVLEIVSPAEDLHGLGKVWKAVAKACRKDNTGKGELLG